MSRCVLFIYKKSPRRNRVLPAHVWAQTQNTENSRYYLDARLTAPKTVRILQEVRPSFSPDFEPGPVLGRVPSRHFRVAPKPAVEVSKL